MTCNPVGKVGLSDIGSEGSAQCGCWSRDMWVQICGGRGDQAAIHPAPPRQPPHGARAHVSTSECTHRHHLSEQTASVKSHLWLVAQNRALV